MAALEQLEERVRQLEQGQVQLLQRVQQLEQNSGQQAVQQVLYQVLQQQQQQHYAVQQLLQQAVQQQQQMGQLQQSMLQQGCVTPAQRTAAARRANAAASDAPYLVLPCADGRMPAAWPAGMGLAALRQLGSAQLTALLTEYGLAAEGEGGDVEAMRLRLAHFIGAQL